MNGRGSILVGVLCALIGLGVGAHWGASRQEPIGSADSEIRALLNDQVESWNSGDLDRFLKPYWNDLELTFFVGGDVRQGYDAVRERYRKNYQAEGKEMGKLTFSDLTINELSAEWATARAGWKVQMKKETLEGLFTLVLRRFPDGWKIVHDHTSRAEPPKKPE
jgi:uncharacterized protein (TIGR02246 family)